MLIWICALHCEAKPVIDHYRLKKSPRHHAFDLFYTDDIICVVSGLGKTAAAAATAWVAGLQHDLDSICWINLGVAGSADFEQGNIFSLNKITDHQTKQSFYPVTVFNSSLKPAPCLSLDEPGTDYQPKTLFDMEASGFFSTATRFSSAELVHSLKVISDNPSNPPVRDKTLISALIEGKISGITDFAEQLIEVNQAVIELESMPDTWHELTRRLHFSQTQQVQLKSLIGFLQHLDSSHEKIFAGLDQIESARDVIQVLQQHCHQYSRNL